MKKIIAPVDRDLIKQELTAERFVRNTNKGGNQIYIITQAQAPNVMREIGRLREWSFRLGGGGSGEEVDYDEFDILEPPLNQYKQLIVWDPEAEEILGGYRYLHGKDWSLKSDGQPYIVTEHMFRFSEKFMNEYAPYTIDLGRAFIHPDYQSSKRGAKSIFAFDNLWDGLLVLNYFEPHEIRYVIGKITVYPDFNPQVSEAIFYFLDNLCADTDGLLTVKDAYFDKDSNISEETKALFDGCEDREAAFLRLGRYAREHGVSVPPLISSYFKLSPTMRSFGTGINREFGNILDTGLMVQVSEIDKGRWSRHVDSFLKDRANREGAEE
ncbi:MAG: GNAT family N-acetyltransferase [Paludibacteraceae bacterium]|nr:GNAT family N-acetyltransferase [Paludibacteraceae bacterium]